MEPKKKINKVPASVVSWYNKLYLERKGSTKSKFPNKLLEATKSWVSLNELEKKYFYTKYEECKDKYNEKFLTSLQKAEPFMKEKVLIGKSDLDTVICNEDNYNGIQISEEHEFPSVEPDQLKDAEMKTDLDTVICNEDNYNGIQISEEHEFPSVEPDQLKDAENDLTSPNNKECEQNTERNNWDPPETLEEQENCNGSQEDVRLLLSEPTPPIVKTGKEFFEMIRFMGEKNDSAWISLSQIERSRYNQAVLSIKKEYIQKYTTYLENLSQRDLFGHYNKIFI